MAQVHINFEILPICGTMVAILHIILSSIVEQDNYYSSCKIYL